MEQIFSLLLRYSGTPSPFRCHTPNLILIMHYLLHYLVLVLMVFDFTRTRLKRQAAARLLRPTVSRSLDLIYFYDYVVVICLWCGKSTPIKVAPLHAVAVTVAVCANISCRRS